MIGVRIAARIDQVDAGGGRGFGPGAALEALEMRHEADRPPPQSARASGTRGQGCGRGPAKASIAGSPRPAAGGSPSRRAVRGPRTQWITQLASSAGQRLVAAVARPGDQLHSARHMARVEHRADAQEQLGWIVVEEVRQQAWPEQRFSSSPKFRAAPCQRYSSTPLSSRRATAAPPPAERGTNEAERIGEAPAARHQTACCGAAAGRMGASSRCDREAARQLPPDRARLAQQPPGQHGGDALPVQAATAATPGVSRAGLDLMPHDDARVVAHRVPGVLQAPGELHLLVRQQGLAVSAALPAEAADRAAATERAPPCWRHTVPGPPAAPRCGIRPGPRPR